MHSAFGGNSQRTSAGIPGALTTSRADRIVVDMWGIVSLLGLSVAADPLRIGIAMLLTSGPRPLINLVSFWLGSLAAGVALGVGAFVLFPELVSEALRVAVGWIASLTGGHAKLVAGTVALCVAAASAMRLARRPTRRPTVRATRGLQTSSGVASRARDLLHGGRPWVSFTAGLSQGPAPVEYLAAISVIHASGAAIGTQLGASVAFIVAMLAAVEVLLVSFVVKPAQTQSLITNIGGCCQAYRQHILTVGAAVVGIVMVVGSCPVSL
ncbi:hypothetical protein Y900_026335 [Mycolicibacterium aromaticivorans JS19b1 = JCM 16368]|uniref:Gap protein n=2 Tax=Mycolicibacterium aromaticivorans TaxID=318425 RepID=A0A064CPA0_9MYCO|nr:hypothetical protein Y900_026335 [Mycolicibacterium aromaticivorans JS19b1 = JCM 16368]